MPKVICENSNCDVEYFRKPSHIKKGYKRFCSNECKKQFMDAARDSRWNTICARDGCGEKYYVLPSKKKNGLGKYCSHECYGLDKRGKSLSNEHKENIGKATKQMWEDGVFDAPHIREAYSKQGKSTKGSKWTDKQRKALSEQRKGKIPHHLHTPEIGEKISKALTGKKQSAESNKKRSDTLKGRKFSEEHRNNLSAAHDNRDASTYFGVGSDNPNWKGGITDRKYPNEFRTIRSKIRDRDSGKCKICLSRQEGRAGIVHHIDADKNNNDESNLLFLCRRCHGKIHSSKGTKDLVITAFRSMLKY